MRRPRTRLLLAAAFALNAGVPGRAVADDARSLQQRVVSTAVAVVPGVIVHGAGQLSAGETSTGKKLLAAEGIGIGLAAGGLIGLGVTGASRKLVLPFSAMMVVGAGLFLTSWFADLYGSAAPDGGTGDPLRIAPAVETSAGYRYVYDPTFAYRSFFVNAVDVRWGPVRVRPEGWFGLGHANERLRVLGAFRLHGPMPQTWGGRPSAAPSRDGSYVDLELAATRHFFGPERFTITSGEVGVAGRLDLVRIGRSLRGSFVDGSIAYGLAAHSYEVTNASTDAAEQFLARWGFGAYLGSPDRGLPYGEVSAFYDHRHDGFVAGMKIPGVPAGIPGGAGVRGLAWLSPEIGALAEAQVGSAWVFGASILLRQAVTR